MELNIFIKIVISISLYVFLFATMFQYFITYKYPIKIGIFAIISALIPFSFLLISIKKIRENEDFEVFGYATTLHVVAIFAIYLITFIILL